MVSAVRNGSVFAYLRISVIMTTFSNVIDVIRITTQTIIISADLKPDFLHNMNGGYSYISCEAGSYKALS
jgi:hypothetical protein